jgi:transketolase
VIPPAAPIHQTRPHRSPTGLAADPSVRPAARSTTLLRKGIRMDTMRERFSAVASRLLDEDPRAAVVLAVISSDRFTDAARAHPDRVIDVGIREQLLVGATGGLALAGLRPIAHSFASFLVERPFEQVKLDLGHQGVGAVLVSAGGSYDVAGGGRTHQAPGDVALLDTLDGWTVHVPGHPDEAEALLRHAVADGDNRVYVRLSEQSNREPLHVAPGAFHRLRSGRAGVVVAVGPMLDAVREAVAGLDVTLLYASTVRPFDARTLRAEAGRTSAADVVLVEPYLAGTSVPHAAEALADLPHRLLGLGTARPELRRYGTWPEHVTAHGLDAASLRDRIGAFLR